MNMTNLLQLITLPFLLLSSTTAKDPELPLCPTTIPYFPQTLPMHCRMPGKPSPNSNNAITIPPGYFQNPPDKQPPNPMPMGTPGFPGMPGMPPGMPLPGMPMPGAMPIPIGMPGPPPMPGQKLPVIVMPFYRPDNSDKNNVRRPRRPRKFRYSSETESSSETETDSDRDTDTDTSDGSDTDGWFRPHHLRRSNTAIRHRRHKKKKSKKHLLTPVLQYVTKDGYVIFEKRISKDEAKDWLTLSKNKVAARNDGENTRQSIENIQIDGHPRLMSDTDDEEDIKLETKPEQVKARSKKVMKKKARRVTLKNLANLTARESETKEKNSEA